MRLPAILLASLSFGMLLSTNLTAQSDCTALNTSKGESKFTGQISSVPDGSSMQVSYAEQTVLVRYTNSTSVCMGGQIASSDVLVQGASISAFGPEKRTGSNLEIDATRIFVTGRPKPAKALSAPAPQSTMGKSPAADRTSLPDSVILRNGTQAENLQRLHVVRRYALDDLRKNTQIKVGEARFDFRPVLANPKALFNIAAQLHNIPQHVRVVEDTSETSEVDEGLVLHHVLAYSILPGKCGDAEAARQLGSVGISCFTRASADERIAEFSKPGTPRYVANVQKRQEAIAAYRRNSQLEDADASRHIEELRKALADPTQRAAIVAKLGQSETARMDHLTDDQLKEEMINQSVQRFEETLFVPKDVSTNIKNARNNPKIAAAPAEIEAVHQLLQGHGPQQAPSNYPKLLKVIPSQHQQINKNQDSDRTADIDFGPYVFLTGFTLGRDYEWKWGAGITVNWCVVGCSATYGFDLHAKFAYGLGLRFPIQAQLKYHALIHPNNSAQATVTATFKPIQGTQDDFFASGLPADQMFDAKELVAELDGDAGFDINLPGLSPSNDQSVGMDATKYLPAPFTNGSFLPPAPGIPAPPAQVICTDDACDLLFGLLNYGVIGGQLFPAVEVGLFSNKLQFSLDDEVSNRITEVTSSGQTISLGANSSAGTTESRFRFGNPVYNLEFSLTPGVDPSIFVDISIWSNRWNFPIWFPQATIDLPPNGIDFACHDNTTCVMEFQPSIDAAGQARDISKEVAAADRTLLGGGCQRVNGQEGNYLCPVKGMLGLCKAMLSNGAVSACAPLVPNVVDEILKRGHCTGGNGAYACPKDMMGLCQAYLKNQEILSCQQK